MCSGKGQNWMVLGVFWHNFLKDVQQPLKAFPVVEHLTEKSELTEVRIFRMLNQSFLCSLLKTKNSDIYLIFSILQEAKKITFMAFVGICIIFQAIISDIYVFNKRAKIPGTTVPPLTPTTLHASSIVPPTTWWMQSSEKGYFKIKCR